MPGSARILLTAPAVVIRQTWDDAVQRLPEVTPQLIIVCYVFDEMRPYRFIQHVRDTQYQRVPIFLIRAVSVPLGATLESDLRRSYVDLGVNAFLNFSDLANERGLDVALQEFRRVVISLLPPAVEAAADD
jgi:CheY-like chemotaxis protein